MLRCQAGETSGFEDLVQLMQQPLLYYTTKLTGNVTRQGVECYSRPKDR